MTRLCTCPGSLPSLCRKKIKSAEGSCKTCGGRFLADGIVPISGTMLGTGDLEGTNPITMELSWKTATKGKRSRKQVARNLNESPKLAGKSPKRVGDFSGPDIDKFCETASGQTFPDRIECVPLKKRRHLLRSQSHLHQALSNGLESSSPQVQTPSSQSEDLERLSDQNGSSGQHSSGSYSNRREVVAEVGSSVDDGALGDKVSGVTGGELCSLGDFSGIALLATAACINNMDDDTVNVKGDVIEVSSALQCSDTSTYVVPVRESISCSVSENQIRKDLPLPENKNCSSVADYSVPAGRSSDENEECTEKESVSSKLYRRHWDLNTFMEAWEEPHDDVATESKSTIEVSVDGRREDKLDSGLSAAAQSDPGNDNYNCEKHMPIEAPEKVKESSESKTQEQKPGKFPCLNGSSAMDKDIESSESKMQEKKSGAFPCLNGSSANNRAIESSKAEENELEEFPSPVGSSAMDNAIESKTQEKKSVEFPCLDELSASYQDGHPKSPGLGICKSESLHFPFAESSHGSGIIIACGNMDAISGCRTVVHAEDGKNVMGSTVLETTEQKVVLPEVLGLEKSGHENDACMQNAEDGRKTIELPENKTNLKGEVTSEAGNTQGVENSESSCENHHHPLSKCEDLSTSDISVCSQFGGVSGNGNGEEEKCSSANIRRTEAAIYPDSREIIPEHDDHFVSSRLEEKTSDMQDSGKEPVDDSRKSDVFEDDHGHLDGGENIELEDGELRGSLLYCWEENELEDGEHECVDYESDGRVGEYSEAGDYPGAEVVEGSEGSQGTEKKSLLQIPENDARKSSSGNTYLRMELHDVKEKSESGGRKGSNQGSGATDGTSTGMLVDRSNSIMQRTHSSDRVDPFDTKGSYMGEVGLKTTKGKLQSHIEGASSMDMFERNTHQGRSRNVAGSFSRLERDCSPDRVVPRYRSAVSDRNGDNRWIYWDSRNRQQSNYRAPQNHGQTRSRNGIADSADKFGGLNFHDPKQPLSYSSKGMQRPFVRRRSPIDRVDSYGGVNRRIAGINNHRSRGSSGNFSEGIGRGPRDEYGEPVTDDAVVSSGRVPHYLSRGDWSFSTPSRVTHVSALRRKSRSRSRTRSPPRAWQSQRGNIGTGRHSRSPEFRPESRVDRMRAPFQKPKFASDYGESCVSPPRGRFSPQRNYRWADNRNFEDDNFRHRRSPVGGFRRNQNVGFSGRLKSDTNHFRSMGRPGRFPPMDGAGRDCKLEENCNDKRNDEEKLDQTGFSGRLKSDDQFRPMGRRGRFPPMDDGGRGEENCDDRRNDERFGMPQKGKHPESGNNILRRSRQDAEERMFMSY